MQAGVAAAGGRGYYLMREGVLLNQVCWGGVPHHAPVPCGANSWHWITLHAQTKKQPMREGACSQWCRLLAVIDGVACGDPTWTETNVLAIMLHGGNIAVNCGGGFYPVRAKGMTTDTLLANKKVSSGCSCCCPRRSSAMGFTS